MMEDYLQTEWPDLKVWLTSTTEQWAVIALNGPNARKVLEPLVEGIDLSPEAFPHMAVSEGRICGVPTRLFRVSFTGELGFEVNVPARYGRAVWEAIHKAGQPYGIVPYGTETMHVLRAEKGYIIIGQDTDGTLTPDDAGIGWAIGKQKPDFVGKRSLSRTDMLDPNRKHLVGLLTDDPKVVLEEGAQIVAEHTGQIPATMIGHVTSSYWSETLGRSIAMAVICGGKARQGQKIHVPMPDTVHSATVGGTVFYDPKASGWDVTMDTIMERSALHGARLAPLSERLTVSLAPQCGRIVLRAAPENRAAVSAALGFPLPAEIGELGTDGGALVACLGPDEWQLLVAETEVAAIESRLEPLRDRCSVVDVSHRELGIEVKGSAATLALSGFCVLDLDAMTPGSVTRTILDKATVILFKHATTTTGSRSGTPSPNTSGASSPARTRRFASASDRHEVGRGPASSPGQRTPPDSPSIERSAGCLAFQDRRRRRRDREPLALRHAGTRVAKKRMAAAGRLRPAAGIRCEADGPPCPFPQPM